VTDIQPSSRPDEAGGASRVESPWATPLGRWLRGVVYDSTSTLPSLGRVVDAVRTELDKAPRLGMLLVRLEYWGRARELFGFQELADVHHALAQAAADLIGKDLRKVDLPTDLGMHDESFAVVLSAPREVAVLEFAAVESVAERLAAAMRDLAREMLPEELAERLSIEVGGGLLERPGPDGTIEDVFIAALVAADRSARAKQQARLDDLATRLSEVLAAGPLDVLFQPVVDLASENVCGYDARVQGWPVFNEDQGDVVMDIADRTGLVARAYDAYHRAALGAAEQTLRGTELLLLRVAASELLESAVRVNSLLYGGGDRTLTAGNVVFVLAGADAVRHMGTVAEALGSASEMGFKLAIEIPPDCALPLDYLREIEPDFLRVGGRSVRGLHHQQDEFELLLMLSRFAARHGMRLIASDCREKGEAVALKRAGVAFAHGDQFGAYAPASTFQGSPPR
jgi:EAL domain-containing protein (putative c-di-GMP-specific phosphodiesterase class I)